MLKIFRASIFVILLLFSSNVKAYDTCAAITGWCIASMGGDMVLGNEECGLVTSMKEVKDEVQAESAILNSRDKNEDGFNDYAGWVRPEYDSPAFQDSLSSFKDNSLEFSVQIRRKMMSPCGSDNALYDINGTIWQEVGLDRLNVVAATQDPEHTLYGFDRIDRLAGCIEMGGGQYTGWTYLIYEKENDPKYADECDGNSSAIIMEDFKYGSRFCFGKDETINMSIGERNSIPAVAEWNNMEIEATPLVGLICANAVICDAYGYVYPLNDGTEDESKALIECQDRIGEYECDSNFDGDYSEECIQENIETHFSGECVICDDRFDCEDSDGYYDPDNCNPDKAVCGSYFDKSFLAHCVVDESTINDVINSGVLPDYLSGYCTGEIDYTNGVGFIGRIMRCIEYTTNNIMFGVTENISDGELEYLLCQENGSVVEHQSECSGGALQRIQDNIKNLVTLTLVLATTLMGLYVVFGAVGNFKEVYKFIFVIGIISYFVMADGWRDGYYMGLQSVGGELGSIVFSVADYGLIEGIKDEAGNTQYNERIDGCYYNETNRSGPFGIRYEHNRDIHFSVWDIFDCKFNNFLYGSDSFPDAESTFNDLLKTSFFSIFLFIFPISIGLVIILLLVYLSFKVAFFAITSFIVLTLLLFISPMIIPLAIFKNKKIKGIFESWFSQLIGYSLVPLILMALIAITFLVFDYALYGSAGDVLEITNNGDIEVKNDCYESYLPCLYTKLANGEYKTSWVIFGYRVPGFPDEFFTQYLISVLRMFLMILVMIHVFSTSVTQLVNKILEVELIDSGAATKFVAAIATTALKYGGSAVVGGGKRGFGAGRKAAKGVSKKGASMVRSMINNM